MTSLCHIPKLLVLLNFSTSILVLDMVFFVDPDAAIFPNNQLTTVLALQRNPRSEPEALMSLVVQNVPHFVAKDKINKQDAFGITNKQEEAIN